MDFTTLLHAVPNVLVVGCIEKPYVSRLGAVSVEFRPLALGLQTTLICQIHIIIYNAYCSLNI